MRSMLFDLYAFWEHIQVFLIPYPPLRCSIGTVGLRFPPWEVCPDYYHEFKQKVIAANKRYYYESLGPHPYEVSIGIPDYYESWKRQALQVSKTYGCLSHAKWIPQKWQTEQLLASSARSRGSIIDAGWFWHTNE